MKVSKEKISVFLMAMIIVTPLFSFATVRANTLSTDWFNGAYQNNQIWDYSTNLSHPNYGTHDWIADHAMNLLPPFERSWIQNNLNAFLLGTEAPDNANLSYLGPHTGYGDFSNHVVSYNSSGGATNDAAARRALEEYNKAAVQLPWNESLAAYYAGSMAHYISDPAVFAHVMGGSSLLPGAMHHSEYERGVETKTLQFNGGQFEKYIVAPNSLTTADPYNTTLAVARTTTFGYGSTKPAQWMDQNIPLSGDAWSMTANPTFTNSAGDSLYRAVVATAKVLHTLSVAKGYTLERIPQSGTTRYDTAVGISKKVFPTNLAASTVVLVSGNSYVDAIAAGPFAKQKNGVVLLSDTMSLPTATLSEIQRILPNNSTSKVYIIGGNAVIDPSVETYLESHFAYTVERVGELNRYDTSARLAHNMTASTKAFLTQTNAVDGIAAAGVGARDGIPVLITKPDTLSDEIADFLASDPKGQGITTVYVLGGTGAVSTNVANQVTSLGKTVVRLAGVTDRFDTARVIADTFYVNPTKIALANGYSMVDAVAGSVLAGRYAMPTLLTSTSPLPATTQEYIDNNAATLQGGYIFGGTGAVSYNTERVAGIHM
jgi:putative cell wall-binding protein